jgi:hypothetical protein
MAILNRIVCFLIPVMFSSCQVYRSNFDCPPGKGVPCTPVTDIEKMIVETPDGSPDIFLGYLPSLKCDKNCNKANPQLRKVWIEGKMQPSGLFIEGHYIYLNRRDTP